MLSADRMCLCGMLAAEYQTLPEPLQQAVCASSTSNTTWLRGVLEQGREDGSLAVSGTAEDTAPMVLGALEGAMLITRLDGDVARFTATAERLLAGLVAAQDPACPGPRHSVTPIESIRGPAIHLPPRGHPPPRPARSGPDIRRPPRPEGCGGRRCLNQTCTRRDSNP